MPATYLDREIKEALDSAGGPEQLVATKEEYSGSVMFLNTMRQELLKKYRRQWVAIYRSKVEAAAKEYDDVISKLQKKHIPIEKTVIKYLSDRKMLTLF
jgi:ribosomal protein L20